MSIDHKGNSMKNLLSILLVLFEINGAFCQEVKLSNETPSPFTIKGSEVYSLTSQINGTEYKIYVQLPKSYRDSTSKIYPVMYMLDANNVFGMAVEITTFLQFSEEVPEIILVGIGYGVGIGEPGNNRVHDFLPTVVPERNGSGGGLAFLEVISNEIIPFVEGKFRIEGSNRGLWGGSAGGLLALTALFQKPELFKKYIINSPVFYSDAIQFNYEQSYAAMHTNLSADIFTCVGALESEEKLIKPLQQLVEKLEQRNYKNLKILYKVLDGEGHTSGVGRAFSDGVRFVYKKDRQ